MKNNKINFLEALKFLFIIMLMSPFFLVRFISDIIKKIKLKKFSFIIYFELYILITVLLFYFGPIDYPEVSVAKTAILIILYNVFFVLGYLLADKKIHLESKEIDLSFSKWRKFFVIGGGLSIIFSLASLISYSGTFNPATIINDIKMGISDPGESYFKNAQIERESGIVTQMMTLLSPITYAIIPLGLFHFKKLITSEKVLIIFVILLDLLTFIIKGTNFGIFKIAIIFISIFLINRETIKVSLTTKVIIGFALFYFLFSISGRMQLTSIPYTIHHIDINRDHPLFTLLPISLSVPIMLGISYISQGYYGLSLTSLYDFESTFGVGNGRFFISKVESIFNISVWERTYQSKMELLWDSRVNWHTIYVWFANDVGLYGVILIMAIIGFLFCLILKDVRENNNLIGIILLPLYLIMLIFIPANNIIFDNPLLVIPFLFFNLLWILSKSWSVRI